MTTNSVNGFASMELRMNSDTAFDSFASHPVETNVPAKYAPRINAQAAVLALIAISGIVHLFAAGATGLGTDESYTVANSRILSWSYVDYPPLHVWLVGVWSTVFHTENASVVRLPFVALFAGSTWFMFALTRTLFGERAGLWSALAFNVAPIYALSQGTWVLPDGPLTLFLLAGAYVIAREVFKSDQLRLLFAAWLCAGALAGLAMLSKYHGAFLALGTLAFLATWAPGRRLLCTPGPWLAALLALAIFAPVIAWNAAHGWIGLLFQSGRLTKSVDPNPVRLLANIGGQALYLAPWLFVVLAVSLWRALRDGPRDPRSWYLALLAIGPIVFFTAASLSAKSLPHWPMPGWLFAFPLLGREIARWERYRPRLLYPAMLAAVATTAILLVLFLSEAKFGWIADELPSRLAERDPTLDLLNWHEVSAAIRDRHLLDAATPAIAGTRWMEAGKLNYAIGRSAPVLCLCDDPQQFRFSNDLPQFTGRNILLIGTGKAFESHGRQIAQWFARLEPLAPIVLHRAGHDAMELVVFRGIGFRPTPFGSSL
jgi:hypothetical protein